MKKAPEEIYHSLIDLKYLKPHIDHNIKYIREDIPESQIKELKNSLKSLLDIIRKSGGDLVYTGMYKKAHKLL